MKEATVVEIRTGDLSHKASTKALIHATASGITILMKKLIERPIDKRRRQALRTFRTIRYSGRLVSRAGVVVR